MSFELRRGLGLRSGVGWKVMGMVGGKPWIRRGKPSAGGLISKPGDLSKYIKGIPANSPQLVSDATSVEMGERTLLMIGSR